MLINFIGKPSEIDVIACSGGEDSMVLRNFLKRGGHKPKLLFFHHNTETSEEAYSFLKKECKEQIIFYQLENNKPDVESWEEYWHLQRHKIIKTDFMSSVVCMGHHLNDAMESYVYYMMNGKQWTIPYQNGNIVRPMLTTPKKNIREWAERYGVKFIEDKSNADCKYKRNHIRHNVLPVLLTVNAGFDTIVKKFVESHL